MNVAQDVLSGLVEDTSRLQQLLDGPLEPEHGAVEAVPLGAPAEERQGRPVAHHGIPDERPGGHEQQLVPQRNLQTVERDVICIIRPRLIWPKHLCCSGGLLQKQRTKNTIHTLTDGSVASYLQILAGQ